MDEDASNDEPYADENDHDQDTTCLYCNASYSQYTSKELGMRNMQCSLWAHSECAGLFTGTKAFVCEIYQ